METCVTLSIIAKALCNILKLSHCPRRQNLSDVNERHIYRDGRWITYR